MAGSEERLLKDYFDGLSGQVEEVSEVRLNAAVRSGMSGPARYRISTVKKRFAISLAVIVTVALLFMFPGISKQAGPHNAKTPPAMVQSTGEFPEYLAEASKNIALYDQTTVVSAIEAGLVQRLSGVTSQQNGFMLTVDGIAADRKGIILLYSLQNKTKQRARVNSLQLSGKEDKPVNNLLGARLNISEVPTGTTRGYEVLQWAGEFGALPEQITLDVQLGEYKLASLGDKTLAKLSVPILLDKEQMAKTGEVINLDKTLTVAGQDIEINEVYISTTGVYMDYAYSQQNSKQIFALINPQFLIGSKGDFTNLAMIRTLVVEGKNSMVFANDSRNNQPLRLQIDGIQALDKETTELIIDTEKQKIIKAPDNNLKMSLYNTDKGSTMILKYYSTPEKQRSYDSLMLDAEFKDGAGKVHSAAAFDISIPKRTESEDLALIPILDYMGLGSNKYAQPLTFTITGYPNSVKEAVSLSIRK